jgi:hypothetical protein
MSQALDLPAGSPLRSLDAHLPALVVFLRSFGCTFCREAMADVAAVKTHLQSEGAQIAFVHGGSPDEAAPWFSKYALGDVTVISDPGLAHYRAFGLGRTSVQSLVSPRVWTRGVRAFAWIRGANRGDDAPAAWRFRDPERRGPARISSSITGGPSRLPLSGNGPPSRWPLK